jgi:hypothetical protein
MSNSPYVLNDAQQEECNGYMYYCNKIYCPGELRILFLMSRKSKDAIDWIHSWKSTLLLLLEDVPFHLRQLIASISIDGTSATTIIIDRWVPFRFVPYCLHCFPFPCQDAFEEGIGIVARQENHCGDLSSTMRAVLMLYRK